MPAVPAAIERSPRPTPKDLSPLSGERPVRAPYARFDPSRIVGEMTVAQWFAFLQTARQKHDYVNGKVVLVPGGSYEHTVLCTDITTALSNACQAAQNGCDAVNSEMKVFVREGLYYFPDVTVLCGPPQLDFTDSLRNPVVIVEVLSPSTETDDHTDKFRDYQTIESLRHYILVEQNRPSITHYAKQDNGLWAIAAMPTRLDDVLTLSLNGTDISLPLSQIYRRVSFPDLSEIEAAKHDG